MDDKAAADFEDMMREDKVIGDTKLQGEDGNVWFNFGADVIDEFSHSYNEMTRIYHIPRNPDTARMLLATAIQASEERAEEAMRKMLHGLGMDGKDQDNAIKKMPLHMPPSVFETVFQQLIDALGIRD